MDRRPDIHGSRSAVSVSSRSCEQSGRRILRLSPSRLSGSTGGMDRFHDAVRHFNDGICLRRQRTGRNDWIGGDSRSETRRGRDRCASRLGHGSRFVSRPTASVDRRDSGIDDAYRHLIWRSNLFHSNGRNCGFLAMSDICTRLNGITRSACVAPCRCHLPNVIFWAAYCSSRVESLFSRPCTFQCLLSIRCFGIWRRPCRTTLIE